MFYSLHPVVLGSKALPSFRTHVAVIGQVDQERVKILPEFHEEKTSPQRKQKATPRHPQAVSVGNVTGRFERIF
jgi:hypothetical protein